MNHVLAASQFDTNGLAILFAEADKMQAAAATPTGSRLLTGKHQGHVMATLFYEPSTRTRLSFESAAQRLGLGLISTENAREFSSAAKGETLEDSIRVIDGYADVIVLRHHETGAASRAAAVSRVPIINAGDGKGEHPTQALLDVYTVLKELSRLDNLTIVAGGDLAHGRTVRSFVQLMSLYAGNKFCFVSTPELKIGDDIKSFLKQKRIEFRETDNLLDGCQEADVIYWTRLQKERLENKTLASNFVIDKAVMKTLPKRAIIMHPLPRVGEIAAAVDRDPRAAYFRQAENGLYMRMVLIDQILSNKSLTR